MNQESFFVLKDVPSIGRLAARPLPDDLKAFLDWIQQCGGGVAQQWCLRLQGDLLDDYWIEYGSDLADHFTFFGRFFDGSRLAIWYPDEAAFDDGPIVLVGSEGKTAVVGATSLHFLTRLAYDDSLHADLDDLPETQAMEPFRSHLRDWLSRDRRLEPSAALAMAKLKPTPGIPDLKDWFEKHAIRTRTTCAEDPVLIDLHRLLAELVEESRFRQLEPWQFIEFVAVCLAEHCEVWEVGAPRDPVPPSTRCAILPLVHEYRRVRTSKIPERGAWFQAYFSLKGPDDWAPPTCIFDEPPAFGKDRGRTTDPLDQPHALNISVDDFNRELSEHPRSRRWTPAWLSELTRT